MRKFVFLNLMLLLLMTLSVRAQDRNYQLSELSVEDYIRGTSSVVNQFTDHYDKIFLAISQEYNFRYGSTDRNIFIAISQEYNLRYGSIDLTDISLDSLIDFQSSIGIGVDIWLVIDEREWFEAILELGLRELESDVLPTEFSIGNFDILSTEVDFDGNNQSEYLLEIYDDFSGRQFYALVAYDDVQLLPIPMVGLYGDVVTRRLAASGQLRVVRLEDIDGDGGNEIIIEGSGYGYWADCGDLYVVDWQDGELVNRTEGMFNYCLPMAQFNTADIEIITDSTETIQMIETRVDGWNCQRIRTDTLNLNAYSLDSTTIYAETSWCDLREAANAFTEQDYELAANIYTSINAEFDEQTTQYIDARLALSYAMNNQLADAHAILNNIEPSGQMGDLIVRLKAVSNQPVEMCRVAYDFFVEINATRSDPLANPYTWTPPNFNFGMEAGDPRYHPLPEPSEAGCDYQEVLIIEPTEIPTEIPLLSLPLDIQLTHFVQSTIYSNLADENYENTLMQIDSFLELADADGSLGSKQQLQYWRAVTLELMGRQNEALAEYISIYETYPDSTWAMLAAVHFEEMD